MKNKKITVTTWPCGFVPRREDETDGQTDRMTWVDP